MSEVRTESFPFLVYGANGVIGYSSKKMYAERLPLISCRGANCGVTHFTLPNSWISNNSIACIPKDVADPAYYFYLFKDSSFNDVITGSAQPQITITNLSTKRLLAPPIAIQRRIASILSAYDDLIENNTRRIAILEEMARRTYEEWFVRFRFPGHEGVRMVESELGLVPEGWRAATVATIAERIGATVNPAAFPDEHFEHYSIPAFDAARRAIIEPGRGIMSNKTLLDGDAVLVSKLNPRIPRAWCVSGSSTRKRICSTEFIPFIPRPPYTVGLLYLFFTSAWFQERYLGLAVGTSTSHQRVKPADTERIEAIIPNASVASKADELLAPVLDLVDNLRLKIVNLRTTRDLLLPKLISGELDVSAMPEPEAVSA
jgi:type I restriction enzyme S subunit